VEHCPSGYDESFAYCMHLLYTHLVYSVALAVAVVIVAVSSGLTVLWFRRYRSSSGRASTAAAAVGRSARKGPSETETTTGGAVMTACDVVY